jgi:hypothetical protein
MKEKVLKSIPQEEVDEWFKKSETEKASIPGQIIHHSHNFPRCGNCGAIIRVPAGTCAPCTNCGNPLNSSCG